MNEYDNSNKSNTFFYKNYKDGRLGLIKTKHGNIETPFFIFCATKGAIKGLDHSLIYDDTQIILSNTFHLHDQSEKIEKLGGIHKFINWNKPILTDSGGFQIFSLGNGFIADEIKGIRRGKTNFVKVLEEGCRFKNPKNGDIVFLTPERSIQIQIQLGVDFVVAFDECTTSHAGYEYTKKSMKRSHRWEEISLDYFKKNKKEHQNIYGIIQGGIYEDLRNESIEFVNNSDFFGIAIGGSLGKTKEEMYEVVKFTSEKIKKDRPVHLLGIGKIEDIINLAPYVDSFDCVEPTRIARHGTAILPKNKINLLNKKFSEDFTPICSECLCNTCKNYSKAYIHYLFKAKEMMGIQLLVQHNIFTMNQLMRDIREGLKTNTYEIVKNKWI